MVLVMENISEIFQFILLKAKENREFFRNESWLVFSL